MKIQKIYRLKIALVFVFAAAALVADFGVSAQKNRDRLAAKPTPSPTVTPPTLPMPAPTPVAAVQTIEDLQMRIRAALLRPELQRGQVGVKVVSLDTQKVVFEQNAEKYFMPASNMKSFTVAAALERLSPDFRFITSVFASEKPDANGAVKGLRVFGRGDVSFSTAFNDGDHYKSLDALADRIMQAGVKRIDGDLVGDESYFTGNPIAVTWEWDDLQWYYGAEISALAINDNAVDLNIRPGAVDTPCVVRVQPANTIVKIINTCVTSAPGGKRDFKVVKKLDQNIIEVTGSMPAGDRGNTSYISVTHPAELFVALLRERLEKKGVIVTGQTRVIGAKENARLAVASALPPVELVRFESPPLSLIAAKTMKPSQNTYTETMLWALGEQLGIKNGQTSAERGSAIVKDFLRQVGIPSDSIVQWDASGLSRHNLVTPAALVQLYTYMARQSRYADAWNNSLTIGGIDGTLQNRFKGSIAAGNVRGKTGTIDQVSALSGYVTTMGGERLVFSIIVNGVPDTRARPATIDEIVLALAGFNGRIN